MSGLNLPDMSTNPA